jgi:hypothetical protein
MGLDLVPIGRPMPGKEERFKELLRLISEAENETVGLIAWLKGKRPIKKEALLEEWLNIQIPAYETIGAPKIGRDKEADDWAKEAYMRSDRKRSESDFFKEMEGFYVVELAKEVDGIPFYGSAAHDEHVFRGQLLGDCASLIGKSLVNEAWQTKLADEALDYGMRLMFVVERIAGEKGLTYLKDQREPPVAPRKSIEVQVHIVYSLAKWLIFYGNNGHGYEADY